MSVVVRWQRQHKIPVARSIYHWFDDVSIDGPNFQKGAFVGEVIGLLACPGRTTSAGLSMSSGECTPNRHTLGLEHGCA